MTGPTEEEVSQVMSKMGSTISKKKRKAAQKNIKIAHAACRATDEQLEYAYNEIQRTGMSRNRAWKSFARCRYSRFKEYCDRRDSEVGL